MAQFFHMPQLGSTMEEGTILKWLKNEGDTVKKGDVLLEIETDKATMEVEASEDGVLRKILHGAEAVVPIQKPIAILGAAHEPIDHLLGGTAVERGREAEAEHASRAGGAQRPASMAAAPGAAIGEPVYLSPRARRIAEESGIAVLDLAGLGTGPQGRVIERDVLAYLEQRPSLPATEETRTPRVTPLAARIADELGINLGDLEMGLPGSRVRSEDILRHAETISPQRTQRDTEEKPTVTTVTGGDVTVMAFGGMRKRIADNVAKSAFTAPHVTLTLEVDMTACAEFRAKVIPDIEKTYGARVSYTDILVKAVARALGEHPRLNAALVGEEIRLFAQKNIGVAVALEEGLIVPVVKNAESKALGAISAELKGLVDRARTGKFTPDDLSGGTFSITNLGAFGIDVFDPIIVTGQAAILGVGRIADKPVVVNKEVIVRAMMNLCLSFDHRVLDGAPAARFLQRLKELLENPLLILI
ncbi:MAG TPA: dihydrolipoamide acetyltransferase family protein [Chthonomonadaceae bacterium]|nr:dihydrolipoamide acetyltransferase family protein [Chthonomonadaceae bacterium]